MTETEVAVIGGGASGLMASIASALAGADTIILEHMDRVGKKILATGNGKCNYTNEVQGLSCYRGENPAFAVPVFRQFDQKKTVAFFREIGIEPKIKNGYYSDPDRHRRFSRKINHFCNRSFRFAEEWE